MSRSESPTERWAAFAARLSFDDLPARVVDRARCLVLDTIGTALAASTLGDCCDEVHALVQRDPGTPECTLFGYGGRASALQAAFLNGALAHALNFDANGRAGGHLGLAAVMVPLALAEQRGGVGGRELLTAVALGAELTARLAAALSEAGVDANEKFLEGQLLGYFGAALAGAKVAGCNEAGLHSALGLALMQAAGSRQVSFEGRSAKAIYGAYTNHGAALAALLARQGLDARCAALEGPGGLFGLFFEGRYAPDAVVEALGARYRVESIAFKRWPTSEVLHPFVAASLALEVDANEIDSIRIHSRPHARAWLEPAAERRRPKSAATAANSIFFGVAKCLAHRTLGLADFTPEGIRDPAALALAERTDYLIASQADTADSIEVTMRDGRTLRVHAPSASIEPEFDEIARKFHDCARYAARPTGSTDAIVAAVRTLDGIGDVRDLTRMLGGK